MLNNRFYDQAKFVALIVLPAIGTLYFSLAGLWNLPNAEEVVGTIISVDTFLGVLLGLSSRQYNNSDEKYDGAINIVEGPEAKTFTLSLDSHPDELEGKDEVLFKVIPAQVGE